MMLVVWIVYSKLALSPPADVAWGPILVLTQPYPFF